MEIAFCFSGWIYCTVKEITRTSDLAALEIDIFGNVIHCNDIIETITQEELVDRLNRGEYAISFADSLNNASKSEVNLTDFDVPL